ncbi:MAG: hypothetical protein IKH54_05415 [Bacilli bacterium]|nr:hypothetical protein [Bacilli bacterium]MBR6949608.1 hypothetical protein [Bacilli bacterium]
MNSNKLKLSDIIKAQFGERIMSEAENFEKDADIIKCANNLKDVFKDFNKLNTIQQKAAAVLLAEKMLEEESKSN